jgi:hypothetical protein
MRVTRRRDPGRMGHFKRRANLLQDADCEVDALLLRGGQAVPPQLEFVGELDVPCHRSVCHKRHYAVNGICLGIFPKSGW